MAIRIAPQFDNAEDIPTETTVTVKPEDYKKDPNTGKMVLEVVEADGFAYENISGLRSTLERLKTDNKTGVASLKPFQDLGMDPAALTAALDELKGLKAAAGQDETEQVATLKAEIETIKEGHREAANKAVQEAIAPLEAKLGAAQGQARSLTVDAQLTTAISEAGGSIPLLKPALMREVKSEVNDDGTIKVTIINPTDQTERIGTGTDAMTFEQLVAEKKELPEYAPAFSAEDASGGGGQGGGGGGGGGGGAGKLTVAQVEALTPTEYVKAREEGRI